jgi:hypothetical protein
MHCFILLTFTKDFDSVILQALLVFKTLLGISDASQWPKLVYNCRTLPLETQKLPMFSLETRRTQNRRTVQSVIIFAF